MKSSTVDELPRIPGGWLVALVSAYGLTLLLVNLGSPWALTFHEVNFAGPAREFLRSGDWLVPRIMGKPIWDKPPLMHWSIAASMAVLGTEQEWAARLPAALSALVTALMVAGLAARWFGNRVGLLAGLVQCSSVYVFMQGRLAEADMMLCAAVTAAMASFAVAVVGRDRPSRIWTLAYFGAAGLAFLAKGPIGPALVASGSGLFAVVDRRWAPWRLLLDPVGWGVMLAMILAWPAAAMLREPGLLDVWWQHNVERFNGELSGGGKDPFFYLYTSLWLALPWTPVALLGVSTAMRSGEGRGQWGRLLACWSAGMLLLVSLSAWKHKHYIIPALPPLSIWAAVGLVRMLSSEESGRWARIRSRICPVLPVLAALGFWAGLFFGMQSGSGLISAVGIVVGLVGLGLAIADRMRRRGRPWASACWIFGTAWAAFVTVHSMAMPGFDDYRGQSDLARRLSMKLPEGADLSVVSIPDPQVTYYLPTPVRRHDDARSLADRLSRTPGQDAEPIFIVGPMLILESLEAMGEVQVIDRARSIHPRKGDQDRMIAVELRPDPDRIAAMVSGRGPSVTSRK